MVKQKIIYCALCTLNTIEEEIHFVLQCEWYNLDLQRQFSKCY